MNIIEYQKYNHIRGAGRREQGVKNQTVRTDRCAKGGAKQSNEDWQKT